MIEVRCFAIGASAEQILFGEKTEDMGGSDKGVEGWKR